MTEKQYSLVYYADKGGAFIKNNETGTEWYHDSRASLLEIVNELNGLAEENYDNKAMIEFLSTENTQIMNELKTRTQIQHQLEEENEQLKEELKRCRDWINSDKNDYELTLAFIKNKGYSLKDVLEYEKELKSE